MSRSYDSLGRTWKGGQRSYSIGPTSSLDVIESFEYSSRSDFENNYNEDTRFIGLDGYYISSLNAQHGSQSMSRNSDGAAPIYAVESNFNPPRPGDRIQYNTLIPADNNTSSRPYFRFGVENYAVDSTTGRDEWYAIRPNFGGARFDLVFADGSNRTNMASTTFDTSLVADDFVRITVDWRRQVDGEIRAWMHRTSDNKQIAHIVADGSNVSTYTTGTFGWNLWFDGTQADTDIYTDWLRRLP